ncbi:putative membrane protein [Anaeramoeba flamelloides]|uniref:Membrane protein n=1 Tax=Anaeramoeba flamelloides TaxID=1746091 RepID=A0ABQ8Y2M2_9EUKA|nr:putative membrane protein [Anaeramoeba flamelloides]
MILSTLDFIFHTDHPTKKNLSTIVNLSCYGQYDLSFTLYEAFGGVGASLFFVFIFFLRRRCNDIITRHYSDKKTTDITDFTILVSGLPHDYKLEDVRSFFEKYGKIHKIEQSYDLRKFIKLYKRHSGLDTKIQEIEGLGKGNKNLLNCYSKCDCCFLLPYQFRSLEKLKKKLDKLEHKIDELHRESSGLLQEVKICPVVLIVYQDSHSVFKCLKECKFNPFQKLYNNLKKIVHFIFQHWWKSWTNLDDHRNFEGKLLNVRRAPMPDDLLWENLRTSYFSRMMRKLFILAISIVMIFCFFAFILTYNWYLYDDDTEDVQSKVSEVDTSTPFVLTLIVVVTNFVIMKILDYLGTFSRSFSLTEKESSSFIEIVFYQALNSGLNILYIITTNDIFWEAAPSMINLLIFVNYFLLPLENSMFAVWKRKAMIKKVFLKKNITKNLLRKAYRPGKITLISLYVQILFPIFLTLCFWFAFPLITYFSFIGLIFIFYLHKYQILRQTDHKHLMKYSYLLHKRLIRYFPYLYVLPITYYNIIFIARRVYLDNQKSQNTDSIFYTITIASYFFYFIWNFLIRNSRKFSKKNKFTLMDEESGNNAKLDQVQENCNKSRSGSGSGSGSSGGGEKKGGNKGGKTVEKDLQKENDHEIVVEIDGRSNDEKEKEKKKKKKNFLSKRKIKKIQNKEIALDMEFYNNPIVKITKMIEKEHNNLEH